MKLFILILITALPLQADELIRGWWDIAPREYPDLAITPNELPDNENGLLHFKSFYEKVDECDDFFTLRNKIENGQGYSRVALNSFVSKYQADFDRTTKLISEKKFHSKLPASVAEYQPSSMSAIAYSNFLALRVHNSINQREITHAINDLEIQIQLVRKLMLTNCALVDLLVAEAMYQSLHRSILAVLVADLSNSELERLKLMTVSNSTLAKSLQSAIQSEFNFQKLAISDLYTGKLVYSDLVKFTELLSGESQTLSHLDRMIDAKVHAFLLLSFQPNKTIEIAAKNQRLASHSIKLPLSQVDDSNLPSALTFSPANYFGQKLIRMSYSPIAKQYEKSKAAFQLRGAISPTVIALKSYTFDNGHLPETLKSLVPDYLDSIPSDPFSGAPLLYSKEMKLLWSIGNDFKNTNGVSSNRDSSPFDNLRNLDEPHLVIPF
jgi:hypothetical protein